MRRRLGVTFQIAHKSLSRPAMRGRTARPPRPVRLFEDIKVFSAELGGGRRRLAARIEPPRWTAGVVSQFALRQRLIE